MEIRDLQKECWRVAKEVGWHDQGKDKTPLEYHMLMVSEVVEASEEVRKGMPPIYKNYKMDSYTDEEIILPSNVEFNEFFESNKPEGEAIELADVVIRIADYFEHRGWSLEDALKLKMKYNRSREYRHGNKKY